MIINLQKKRESWKRKTLYFKRQMLLFLVAFMAMTTSVLAQQTNIKGQVTDPAGETIPGVNILEKGTSNGTVTNLDGNFDISISSSDAILVFSFVGFETQ